MNEGRSFCASWRDVIEIVREDWRYEFFERPKLGLESDAFKLRAPLWKL